MQSSEGKDQNEMASKGDVRSVVRGADYHILRGAKMTTKAEREEMRASCKLPGCDVCDYEIGACRTCEDCLHFYPNMQDLRRLAGNTSRLLDDIERLEKLLIELLEYQDGADEKWPVVEKARAAIGEKHDP